jgi:hypothetical protein
MGRQGRQGRRGRKARGEGILEGRGDMWMGDLRKPRCLDEPRIAFALVFFHHAAGLPEV